MSVTNIVVSPGLQPCGQPGHEAGHEDCGLQDILLRLGERWTVMVLAELAAGPRRFRQIERAIDGISQRMLTLSLRRLERDGFVNRTVEPTVPPAVTYELTERGRSFAALVSALVDWSRLHKEPIAMSRAEYDARQEA